MAEIIKLIANPVAGRKAGEKILHAKALLEKRGFEVDLTLTQARGDAVNAARDARQGGFFRVIAAGGDGTLNEVINGLAPSAIPLGFLPLGTTNVFALEAGIPFDVEKACAIAVDGEPRPVCLGRIDDTRFLLMAGLGFDAEAVYRVSGRLKRHTGKLAYVVSALKVWLSHPGDAIRVELEDGSCLSGYGAIICNAKSYGGRFVLTPDASLDSDDLDVCLFLKGGRWNKLRYALKIALGLPLRSPEAKIVKARHVSLSGEGVAVQIDGDYYGRLPLAIKAVPGELVMMFPASARTGD